MNHSTPPNKTALMDASSAIILYKAELHCIVTEMYKVAMTVSVFNEVTANNYPGAREYRKLKDDNNILFAPHQTDIANGSNAALNRLGRGERDTVQAYSARMGNFVITDDGAAAKFCQRKQIPFINALLIPVILEFAGLKDKYFCKEKLENIIDIGRYSSNIISFAKRCKKGELSLFIP